MKKNRNYQLEYRQRWLTKRGYQIKHNDLFYWVDGACGYAVDVYYKTKADAINSAFIKINQCETYHIKPSWLFAR